MVCRRLKPISGDVRGGEERELILGMYGRQDLGFAHTTCKMSALARFTCPFRLFPLWPGLISCLGYGHTVFTLLFII